MTTSTTDTIDRARGTKAAAIAHYLHTLGVTSHQASLCVDQNQRDFTARAAGQHSPSEQTWTLAVGLLATTEADTDVFAGIGQR